MTLYECYFRKNLKEFERLLLTIHPDSERSQEQTILTRLCGLRFSHVDGDEKYIELLLRYGADPNDVSNPLGALLSSPSSVMNPFLLNETRPAIFSLLLQYGVDVSVTNLHQAVSNTTHLISEGDFKIVKFLIDHGSSQIQKNHFGETPLEKARRLLKTPSASQKKWIKMVAILEGGSTHHQIDKETAKNQARDRRKAVLQAPAAKYAIERREKTIRQAAELAIQAEIQRQAEAEKRAEFEREAEAKRQAEAIRLEAVKKQAGNELQAWSKDKAVEQCKLVKNKDVLDAILNQTKTRNPVAGALKEIHIALDAHKECINDVNNFYSPANIRRHPAKVDFLPEYKNDGLSHQQHIEKLEQERSEKIRMIIDSKVNFGSYEAMKIFLQTHKNLNAKLFKQQIDMARSKEQFKKAAQDAAKISREGKRKMAETKRISDLFDRHTTNSLGGGQSHFFGFRGPKDDAREIKAHRRKMAAWDRRRSNSNSR